MKHFSRRALRWTVPLLVTAGVVFWGHNAFLRAIGQLLFVEDALRPAAAIVVLGGDVPYREVEAAKLYHQHWASKVLLVRGAGLERQGALGILGIELQESWELSRDALAKLGVPSSAIIIANDRAEGTLEELQVVAKELKPSAGPVILVTSKFHTRRVRLFWRYVTGKKWDAIVRACERDCYDANHWWQDRYFAFAVVKEYLGFLNYWAGFPVRAPASQASATP
ncbi:MAG TPA: YdcF family protein [Acidobacteriota bacterium]|jgi:uncharacterized SAM-binding protein YcdF (DUF218 family)